MIGSENLLPRKTISNVKNTIYSKYLLLLGICFLSVSAVASNKLLNQKKTPVNHFFTVGASVGYSHMLESYEELSTQGAVSGLLGLGYEMRVKHFYWSLGVEAQLLRAKANYDLADQNMSILDTQGKPAIMHYRFDAVQEDQNLLYVQVPIMFGFYRRGFYIGAGAKIGFPIKSFVQLNSSYVTSVTYKEYIDEFAGMDTHGYGTYTLNSKEEMAANIKTSLAVEIGYDVLAPVRRTTKGMRHGLRLAAICEYGLNNVVGSSTSSAAFDVSPENATQVVMKPFYQAHSITGHSVNNLYAGFKITWICDFSAIACDCDE